MVTFGIPEALPLKYAGPEAATIPLKAFGRRPTVNDKKYPVGQFAILKKNPTTGTEGELWYLANFDTSGDAIWIRIMTPSISSEVIQQVRAIEDTVITCNGQILTDDSIPQQTEGTEVLTATITPTSATSILVIEFNGWGGTNGDSTYYTIALFQDANSDAIQVESLALIPNGTYGIPIFLRHYMTSGTISPTTFKIRIGTAIVARPLYLNGLPTRKYGGASKANIFITEYAN